MRIWYWGRVEWFDPKKQEVVNIPVGPCPTHSDCKIRCERKSGTYKIYELDTMDRGEAVRKIREKMNEEGIGVGKCLDNFKHDSELEKECIEGARKLLGKPLGKPEGKAEKASKANGANKAGKVESQW